MMVIIQNSTPTLYLFSFPNLIIIGIIGIIILKGTYKPNCNHSPSLLASRY